MKRVKRVLGGCLVVCVGLAASDLPTDDVVDPGADLFGILPT